MGLVHIGGCRCGGLFQFCGFHSCCVFRNNEMIYAVLDIAIHECGQIVYGIIDAVIGDASLWLVVGSDFGRTVTG